MEYNGREIGEDACIFADNIESDEFYEQLRETLLAEEE
jgi:hypothetical protein